MTMNVLKSAEQVEGVGKKETFYREEKMTQKLFRLLPRISLVSTNFKRLPNITVMISISTKLIEDILHLTASKVDYLV